MAKKDKFKNNKRITEMKFKEVRKILEDNGYFIDRRTNSTHAKFTNKQKNHSVIVSGYVGGGSAQRTVKYPIVSKIFKECNILSW